jgi:hypothetical protein
LERVVQGVRAESRELRAESREQRAESREQKAVSSKQKAVSREQKAEVLTRLNRISSGSRAMNCFTTSTAS